MDDRISWDRYFINMADVVATRSTCPSRQVGAVIVDPFSMNIVSTGFNGAPRKTSHCGPECLKRRKGRDWSMCRAIHGEMNAIINAAYNGVSTRGCSIYLTCTPCEMCARVLTNAGINRVIAKDYYNNQEISTPGLKELKLGKVDIEILGPRDIAVVKDMPELPFG